MSDPVTVTVTPATLNGTLMDCTLCGPIGTYQPDEISAAVYDHMIGVHDCDPNSIDIRNP